MGKKGTAGRPRTPGLLVALVANDVRQRMRDRPALAAALLAPVVLALVASFSLTRLTRSFEGTYAIVDRDGGEVGRMLERGIRGDARFDAVDLTRLGSEAAARDAAADGRIAAAFVVPEGFSEAAYRDEPARLSVIQSPRHPAAATVAGAIADRAMADVRADQLSVVSALTVTGGDVGGLGVADLAARAGAEPSPIRVDDVTLTEAGRASMAEFYGPSMAIVVLLVIVQLSARSLVEERRSGVLRRELASGVPPPVVLAAKALFAIGLGVTSMLLTLITVAAVTGARWGDAVGVVVLCVATVGAFVAIASLVTVSAQAEESASSLGLVLGLILALVGGNFVPLSQAPGFLRSLSLATPNGWALRGFADLSSGKALVAAVGPSVAALVAFMVVAAVPAWALSRRMVEP